MLLRIILVGCAFAAGAPAGAAPIEDARRARVERLRDGLGLPGITATVVSHEGVIWEGAFGVRNLKTRTPMTVDTAMCVGSLSKGFTAIALGVLVDDGRLAWDEPVRRYMPEFALHDPVRTEQATVRDLLAHRLGITDYYWYPLRQTRPEVVRMLATQPAQSRFRDSFDYSNVVYSVAGELAPAASGYSWDTLLTERLFKPLRMTSASTTSAGLLATPNHAESYMADVDGSLYHDPITADGLWDISSIGPAGSVNASLRDMQRWARMLLGGGSLDGVRVISRQTLDEVFKPANLSFESELATSPLSAYAMGWEIDHFRGTRVVWHSGLVQGHSSMILLLPEKNRAIFVATNSETANYPGDALIKLAMELADIELGQPPEDLTGPSIERLRKTQRETIAKLGAIDAQADPSLPRLIAADALPGTYSGPNGIRVTVRKRAKQLELAFDNARTDFSAVMASWRGDQYRLKPAYRSSYYWPGQIVTFDTDSKGVVTALTIEEKVHPLMETMRFERVAQ